eukprot:scaffold8432_cov168-Skeletonema_marinoi.AAC.4
MSCICIHSNSYARRRVRHHHSVPPPARINPGHCVGSGCYLSMSMSMSVSDDERKKNLRDSAAFLHSTNA